MSWANFIRDDVRARIGQDHDIPDKLTLHGLSRQYDVSTTPVRLAVDELLEEQFLVRHENGRLAVNPRKIGSLPDVKLPQPPRQPRDYQTAITRDLILRSLSGPTEFIREDHIAAKYGISTASVREAFQRLAGQGVLRHYPRRGWELRQFRRKDFEDYLRVREALELIALDQAWKHLDNGRLEVIDAGNCLPKTKRQHPRIDDSLHEYLVEEADNIYIRDFFERHGNYFKMLFAWDAADRDSAMETVRQHHEIVAAMLRRDIRGARRALAHHIRTNYALLKILPTEST
jgi:DNA-binding GntR family transcriptional regulator